MFDVEKIRRDFPILQRKINNYPLIYFDNAATTQRPLQVLDTLRNFYLHSNANIHRGIHLLSHEATESYEMAHRKVAEFINASSWEEIIFLRNATEALNLVMYAYGLNHLKEGDEVVVTISEHHSNIVPWLYLRKKVGIVLKFARVDREGRVDLDHMESLITDKTRIVSIFHASNVTGVIAPVKEVARMAKEKGAIVVVDGAQSLPHIPVDVRDLNVDFYAGSGHKMLGPTGIGFLYGRKELLQEMDPFLYGGDMIMEVTTEGATWNCLPWKFEAGTQNIAGGIGLASAIDYLRGIGMENILKHEIELTEYALMKLSDFKEVKIYGPKNTNDRIGAITFNIEGAHPHDVAHIFNSFGIAIRSGHHCAQPLLRHLGAEGAARASFYIYNTLEEIDKMIEAVKRVIEIFS